jgi:hypothetical protein
MNRAMCPACRPVKLPFICSLDLRIMSAVTRHLSSTQFFGTEAEFGQNFFGIPQTNHHYITAVYSAVDFD